ncbi:MAG: glutamate--tRNA ligase [Phycisphaerae bacterium]|nr:glutamate--tRNA ligase [Phycisphaerae bacterium]
METIKTRFAPSPTGSLHVGGARTALFCYALAKKLGGQFLLRIEDTDRARHQEEAVEKIVEDLRWLGIDWDEGVIVGGDFGPYRQSERLEIYQQHIHGLLESGKAYYAFDTPDELDAMRQEAQARKEDFHYPRPKKLPCLADAKAARSAGKPVVVRLACPAGDVTFRDEVFGDVTIPADQIDDFIIQKADGWPTYHLANVVDDALMGVNFICRGQEFLGQTWRHVLLRDALEYPEPQYAHLPLIMDMDGRKLSKRDGDVEVDTFRQHGYLPEALLNFIALLGWNPKGDREKFTLEEMTELFDVAGVGKSNAKFDRDKLLAFNVDAIADAAPKRLLECFTDFLSFHDTPLAGLDDKTLQSILRSCQGFRTFMDILHKVDVLFAADDSYQFDPKAVKKVMLKNDGAGYAMLADILPLLAEAEWTAEALEAWMGEYCQTNEIGMGKVAQPIRIAVTGTTISPPIFDTLVFLGKEKTLARIQRCLSQRNAG